MKDKEQKINQKVAVSAKNDIAMSSTAETPTPESVAAELKTVAKAANIQDDAEATDDSIAKKWLSIKTKRLIKKIFLAILAVAILTVAIIAAIMFIHDMKNGDSDESKNVGEYSIVGSWKSRAADGSCYIFENDHNYYWLMNCDSNSRYYYGTYESTRSDDALSALSQTTDKIAVTLGVKKETVDKKNVYLLTLHPVRYLEAEVENDVSGNEAIKMLVSVENEKTAHAYRYDSGDSYALELSSDIKTPSFKIIPVEPQE